MFLCWSRKHEKTRKKTSLDRGRTDRSSLTLDFTLTYDIDFQFFASYRLGLCAKVQRQRSVGSEDRVETNLSLIHI